jgi:hypothetical protein
MKKIISIVFVAAIAVAAAWNFAQNKTEVELSDWALENVEALAADEGGGGSDGKTCYNSITTPPSCQVRYCGTCSFVSGHASLFSGTGSC